jgi:hypothetical protein
VKQDRKRDRERRVGSIVSSEGPAVSSIQQLPRAKRQWAKPLSTTWAEPIGARACSLRQNTYPVVSILLCCQQLVVDKWLPIPGPARLTRSLNEFVPLSAARRSTGLQVGGHSSNYGIPSMSQTYFSMEHVANPLLNQLQTL